MTNETPVTNPGGEIIVYEAPDSELQVEVRLEGETVWLTQRQMAKVFDTTPENVLMHLRNVFSSKELEAAATAKDFLVVQTEDLFRHAARRGLIRVHAAELARVLRQSQRYR